MERGRQWSVLLALVLLATSRAEPLDIEILTEWNGAPVEHVPISLTLDSSSQDVLQVVVQAPFFDDPAPPAPENSSYIGLWDYEVVELFLLNDADQYIQVEFSPRGQYFVMLFDGVRNVKRFSLPLAVSSEITGGADASWTATAEIPTDYLPYKVTRVNAYATHGAAGDRHYEAYSPAPSTASEPDYHNLEYFAPIDLDVVIPDLSSRPISELWRNAVQGIIRYSIDTVWNGTPIDHAPVVVMLGGNADEVIFSVEAPFFDDPAPDALPGEPFNTLWNYEVVEVFFLNDENQYLEVEVGPHGQHLDLLLWTKNDTYNQMRHSLPMRFSSVIDRDTATWTGTARIPVDYLPPKVTRFNAYCKHIPGAGRHEESLYPQDATDEVSDFHALKYFRPIDMNSVVPGQSERPMSQLWQDTIQGIFRYEVAKEWNSVNVAHPPTVFTLEGFEAGVELNITAPFYNDPAPGGTPGEPFYGLWDYEVVEMFFLNDNEEYLEVELGPWGEHLLLMLKGQRNAIKHSLPLDYVVTTRENGTSPLPGTWQASALIPPGYFPPNVSRMNAYAIHGTGDDKHYEALYPAPLDDPRYPAPDFHRLELFQKMDFEFLVVDNSQYSDLWLEAIANATTPAPALAHDDSVNLLAAEKVHSFHPESYLDSPQDQSLLAVNTNSLLYDMLDLSYEDFALPDEETKPVQKRAVGDEPSRIVYPINTTWNGSLVVDHAPVTLTLEGAAEHILLHVTAPFIGRDPPPPSPVGEPLWQLWEYEVVEAFFLNDNNQYLEVELGPYGQHIVLLLHNKRNILRHSLPLEVTTTVNGSTWSGTAKIPLDYFPPKVTKFNAYAMHVPGTDRHYESLYPADPTEKEPEFHALEYFEGLDLEPLSEGFNNRPQSQLWTDSMNNRIVYPITTTWNGSSVVGHSPVTLTLEGAAEHILLHITAPFIGRDPPPPSPVGEPLWQLWDYEVVEAFFLNDQNQYLEVEVGPYGQHIVLLLHNKRNILRHSLPMEVTTTVNGSTWSGTAKIPLDYFPPKVTKFNAYAMHVPGTDRHYESLYPADPTEKEPEFHALEYFKALDLESLVEGLLDKPQSQLWDDSMDGVYRYSITSEWNSVPIKRSEAVTVTLRPTKGGVEMNVTAPFFNDPPPPGGETSKPFYKLWDYEVFEMFFLNDNEEYLEVELGPWGQHLLLMLKGERNTIKHSFPLEYVVTSREGGSEGQPGTWRGSAVLPHGYFPPNVTRMNAYAIHGVGGNKTYEALYPAPHNSSTHPEPDFHNLRLFQKIDFEYLIKKDENAEYSKEWTDAIVAAGLTTQKPATTTTTKKSSSTQLSVSTVLLTAAVAVAVAGAVRAWRIFR